MKIQNIVATSELNGDVCYNKILKNKNDFNSISYEPEVYPAVLIKLNFKDKLRHVTLYKNGKMILTAFNKLNDLKEFEKLIKFKLKKYLK